ncbi:hypothetical protein [Streptomyces sp. NPDC001292]|uniref:hypothetical protein n=1 Tax=Streptomyces sp. NPDC001292 TaxID=3364558 RepID=UPI0036ACB5C6
MHSLDEEASFGIQRLEGYLLVEAERSQALADAETFLDGLILLAVDQREELRRAYLEERDRLTRHTLERIVARAAELRTEYTDRYRRLRLLAWSTAAATTATATGLLALIHQ